MFTFHGVYLCVGSVFALFNGVGWSLVDMFGGWLDSFSLGASLWAGLWATVAGMTLPW